MARKGGGGGGGASPSSTGIDKANEASSKLAKQVDLTSTALKALGGPAGAAASALGSVASFAASPITANIGKTLDDVQKLGTRFAGGAAQSLAETIDGGNGILSRIVKGARSVAQGTAANVTSSGRLEDLARRFAGAGLDVDRGLLESFQPFLRAQAGAEEKAAALADDVSGSAAKGELVEAFGLTKSLLKAGVGTARR